MDERVRYELDGRVCRVTMNRPEVKNAQSGPLLRDLDAAFERATAERSVRMIVLGGAGDSFSAGHDLGTPEHVADSRVASSGWHLGGGSLQLLVGSLRADQPAVARHPEAARRRASRRRCTSRAPSRSSAAVLAAHSHYQLSQASSMEVRRRKTGSDDPPPSLVRGIVERDTRR